MTVEMFVIVMAAIGLWYVLIGFAHFLLWAAWRLGVRFPEWMAEHLADEWGMRK